MLGICRIPPACQLAIIVDIQAHAHKLRSPDKHLTIGQIVRLRAFWYRYTPMQSVRREFLRHPAFCTGIGDYLIQRCRIGKLGVIGSVKLRHAIISRYFDAPELAWRAVHRVIADRHGLCCRACGKACSNIQLRALKHLIVKCAVGIFESKTQF